MAKANSIEPILFTKELQPVSRQGQKITAGQFALGYERIQKGLEIDYDGVSGPIEFDHKGDIAATSYDI